MKLNWTLSNRSISAGQLNQICGEPLSSAPRLFVVGRLGVKRCC